MGRQEYDALPESIAAPAEMMYRSFGLGIYAVVVRYATMPLEKIAMIMNSSQVSGAEPFRQCFRIVFAQGPFTPYSTVGRASIVAWFFQYSVMGFVFQICDRTLSKAFNVDTICYGDQLMEPANNAVSHTAPEKAKQVGKALLAPAFAGMIESGVANRAEGQRFFGLHKFAQIEKNLKWNSFARFCGPAFAANSTRNFIMSGTSFVITPVIYKYYYPQEQKSTTSLFWFGLGTNIFFGNVLAITQQSLWGRALDYAAVNGGRNVSYAAVVREGFKAEGMSALFTPTKWFTRVLMNAPIQGTMPFFYNQVLPLGEGTVMRAISTIYFDYLKNL